MILVREGESVEEVWFSKIDMLTGPKGAETQDLKEVLRATILASQSGLIPHANSGIEPFQWTDLGIVFS